MRLHILVLQESDEEMRNRLIIDGNAVYEIDDECVKQKQNKNSGRGGNYQCPFAGPGQDKKQSR